MFAQTGSSVVTAAMHAKPVQRKLVKHPKDWPWRSWSYYAKSEEGLVRIEAIGEGSNWKENLQAVRKKEKQMAA